MGVLTRGEARRARGRRLALLPLALGILAAVPFAGVGAAAGPTIEASEGAYALAWKPATAAIAPGGAVTFTNPSKLTPHGVAWTSGPEKPACSGVPIGSSDTGWSGECTFAQPGTYAFLCTVHPEMQGSVTAGSGGGPTPVDPTPQPPPAPGQPPDGAPAAGDPIESLRLAGSQRGTIVRGSLKISSAGGGGALRIELRARRSALGVAGGGTMRIAPLVRSTVQAGRRPFSIPVKAAASRALRSQGRLAVTLKVVVTPPDGGAETVTRKVVLRV
jgi:plastocyanin